MNPTFTYMWQRQPYIPWKAQTQMLSSAVPTWSRPIVNGPVTPVVKTFGGVQRVEYDRDNGTFGKARPIKHWRKQLDPQNYSGRGRPGVGMPMDVPGGKVALGKNLTSTDCNCENAKRLSDYVMPDNRYKNLDRNNEDLAKMKFLNPDRDDPHVVCVACSPQANVTKPATTVLSKKYYTDSRAYLKARNKRYKQNLSGTEMQGIRYYDNPQNEFDESKADNRLWPSDNQNGIRWQGPQIRAGPNCTTNCSTIQRSKLIYKPSNREFSVQGAVDSSSRIERLKLNTITKSASSMGGRNNKGPFGMEGVNASRYRGSYTAPYFLKSKNEICRPYHIHQNHSVCFFTPTGSIGNRFPLPQKLVEDPLFIPDFTTAVLEAEEEEAITHPLEYLEQYSLTYNCPDEKNSCDASTTGGHYAWQTLTIPNGYTLEKVEFYLKNSTNPFQNNFGVKIEIYEEITDPNTGSAGNAFKDLKPAHTSEAIILPISTADWYSFSLTYNINSNLTNIYVVVKDAVSNTSSDFIIYFPPPSEDTTPTGGAGGTRHTLLHKLYGRLIS